MICFSIPMTWLNERKKVKMEEVYSEAAEQIHNKDGTEIEYDQKDIQRYDGKLVHLTGTTTIDENAKMLEEKSSGFQNGS